MVCLEYIFLRFLTFVTIFMVAKHKPKTPMCKKIQVTPELCLTLARRKLTFVELPGLRELQVSIKVIPLRTIHNLDSNFI